MSTALINPINIIGIGYTATFGAAWYKQKISARLVN